MPYANFDDVASIQALYHQCLVEDSDINVFEFIGEKLLTANIGDDGDEDEPKQTTTKNIPLNAAATIQIQTGVLFQFPTADIILILVPSTIKLQRATNAAFTTQDFKTGIFHPPLV
jgi:hypothetical protein